MENYELLLSYISTIIFLIFTTVTYIIKFIEKQKQMKKLENQAIIDLEIEELMIEAEKLFDSGETREKFVIDRLKSFALAYKITPSFDEIQKRVKEIIALSRKINFKDQETSE